MREAFDLSQLTSELEYLSENRHDYKVVTDTIGVTAPGAKNGHASDWVLRFGSNNGGTQGYRATSQAMAQIAGHVRFSYSELLRITEKGTDREKKALADYLSVRLQENPASRLIRTTQKFWEDPRIVAFLEPSFACPSSYSVLTAILGLGLKVKGLTFDNSSLTDEYMSVKMVAPVGKDGIACGLLFEHSETGSPSMVRPFFRNPEGLTIIPSNHWIMWGEATYENAKTCLTGARSAAKRYTDSESRLIPATVDVKRILEDLLFLDRDETRRVLSHFAKDEKRSHKGLVDAIARYAQNAQKLTYHRVVELEIAAGKALDFTNDTWELYYIAPTATEKAPAKENNGKQKATK